MLTIMVMLGLFTFTMWRPEESCPIRETVWP